MLRILASKVKTMALLYMSVRTVLQNGHYPKNGRFGLRFEQIILIQYQVYQVQQKSDQTVVVVVAIVVIVVTTLVKTSQYMLHFNIYYY